MGIWGIGIQSAGQAVLGAAARLTGSVGPQQAEPHACNQSTADELTLSGGAISAKPPDLVGRLFPGVPRRADGSVNIENIRTYRDERKDALDARLREAFRDAGIDTSAQIRLQVGYDGHVAVANDHPQRDEIEQIFADNPDLRNHFAEVASLSEVIRAGEEASAFQQAYADDPDAAIAEFWHLFSGQRRPDFSLLIGGDESTIEFQ